MTPQDYLQHANYWRKQARRKIRVQITSLERYRWIKHCLRSARHWERLYELAVTAGTATAISIYLSLASELSPLGFPNVW